ncbi:MAG: D-alanyl-lipoteichoic acid biosynthesis protein DltB [Lactobacillaceae bacterium]|jgi:membrane protein involved in D-alanine export|nr:D-alanyl-lipoteichoic acid biosynthesis protein DltB [Lactobacillaceae bacterium]
MIAWLQGLPNWQPYGDPQYLGYLLVLLLPVIIGLLFGRRFKIYETLISFAFIVLMYAGTSWHQLIALLGFLVWQMLLVFGYRNYHVKHDNKYLFYGIVGLAILPIALVKITPAISDGNNSLIGFLGISYLTFRAVAMLMEIRDNVLSDFTVWQFIRFMTFMPTISSGPIDRFRRFQADYTQVPTRQAYLDMLEKAVWYLMLGCFYKFVMSYFLGDLLLPGLKHMAMHRGGIFNLPTVGVMYCYGFNLFFDFAGYSLFAVSISYFMGINTPMNFNKPFLSRDLKDFWNRWHMSLSFWFRDYVFMRMVFVLMKNKVFKNRNVTSGVAYILNMLIMGLWHGVTWYYITYGLFHGCGLVINDWWGRKKKKVNLTRKKQGKAPLLNNRLTAALGIFVTFNVVMFSLLIFSGFLNILWFQHGHMHRFIK